MTLTITAVTVEQLHNPRTHKPEPKAILDFGRSQAMPCTAAVYSLAALPLNQTQCLAPTSIAKS